MDEILKKLLESELLTEDTRASLKDKFNEAVEDMRQQITEDVKLDLTEQFVKSQDQLIEALDSKLELMLESELSELRADIESFRDLEVEYANRFAEEKEIFAEKLNEQVEELVDSLDEFLETRIQDEFQELNEDISEVKKLEFGRTIFEAMEHEFQRFRSVDQNGVEQQLAEARQQLANTRSQLREERENTEKVLRVNKLDNLLESIGDYEKERLQILLANVPTEELDEQFKIYAPRVLRESLNGKRPSRIDEGQRRHVPSRHKTNEHRFVTGDNEDDQSNTINENKETNDIARIKLLAGIK